MKATVKDCLDSFKEGYYAYEDSRAEAQQVWDLYHNRHYSSSELAALDLRGQPKETFNVVKMFARMLVGYYSTVVNTAVARPRHPRDITTATVLNDTIQFILESNRFDVQGDDIKLGALVSGLMVASTNPVPSGERDEFGRILFDIESKYVPDYQIVLDANSTDDDYEDATYMHRFMWMTGQSVDSTFGKGKTSKLNAEQNFLNVREAEYDYQSVTNYSSYNYSDYGFAGHFKVADSFLVVHTVLVDEDDRRWSMFWSGETLLYKKEITYREVKWPYRVARLHASNHKEYYGIFREVKESQYAINQALLQIQLMANTTKVFYEQGAVDNVEDFKIAVNRVNGVIPVLDLGKVKIEQMSRDILEQYTIIDKALDRIQRVLGVNDSFLGMAFASDSGRKVKLQQNATIMSLRYLTSRIESFYVSLVKDIGNLAKQYFRANQFMRLTDSMTGERWVEINKPIQEFTGQYDSDGQPITQPILVESIDPDTQEVEEDGDGNLIFAPVSERGTDFEFTDFDITVESSAYNDEDEKGQLLIESVMSGQIGSLLSQVNPAGFFKVSSLAMKTMGTKYSPQMSQILDETAQMLAGNEQASQSASLMAQGGSGSQAKSQSLKLPQNTNEG